MIYPEFPHDKSIVGVCAPSAGVGNKIESFELSLSRLRECGFRVFETPSVRNDDIRSTDAESRGDEFNFLANEPAIEMILAAAGGDYNLEALPYMDLEAIRRQPKWVVGSSDPTNILFPITTKYDVATIYGVNAGSFDWEELHRFQMDGLHILNGDLITQYSYEKYDGARDFSSEYEEDSDVYWDLLIPGHEPNEDGLELQVSGRLIGGCMDCISKLIGTPFDGTSDFIERYKDEGIIWYFDPFAMDADSFYLTLLQMTYAGYFEGARAVIFGRVLFTNGSETEDYMERVMRLFDIPVILNADIGHVKPSMTLINGSYATVECGYGVGKIDMELI